MAAAKRLPAGTLGLPWKADGGSHGDCVFLAGGADLVIESVPADAPPDDQALVGRFIRLVFAVRDLSARHRALLAPGVSHPAGFAGKGEWAMVFRSKIDLWLLVVLIAPTAMPLVQAISALQAGANWVPHAVLFGLLCGGMLWLLLSTSYTVQPDALLVRSGPFHWRIRREGITRLSPSRSLVSSPALSLDRLKIDYDHGKRSILVSPQDRAGFLQAMASPAGTR